MRWISFPPIRSASGGSVIRSCSILFLTQSIIFSVLIIVSLSLPPSALAKVYPSASDPGAIQTFYMDPQTLWSNRQLWRQGHVGIQLKPAIDRLLRIADAAVADNNVYSVTRKSAGKLPPSGDIHDYYSLARYYWPPNSTTSTTATYVRIDGKPNPEIYSLSDHTYLQVMLNDVFNLGLAYFYTQNQTYAAKATTRIRDWFLTPTTRMNPNLNFANWIKGSNQTSVVMGNNTVGIKITNSGGLLDLSKIYLLLDGIGLIKSSSSFTVNDYSGMTAWLTNYYTWLQHSPRGASESTAPNNQGTWYDVQLVSIALFLGDINTATLVQNTITLRRISAQIMPDGSMPLEQIRPLSWYYSNFNLLAFFVHGALSSSTNVPIMSYSTQDGRSISAALNYQVPVAIDNGTSWKVPNADGTFGKAAVLQLCKDAYVVYQDVKYLDDARQIQGNKSLSWNPSKLWSPYGSYDNIKSLRSSAMRGLEVVGGRTAGIIWPVSRMFLIMVLTTIVNM